MTPAKSYTLWVIPAPEAASLAELDEALSSLYAHIVYNNAPLDRRAKGQIAVRSYGFTEDLDAVFDKLAEMHYTVVGGATRSGNSYGFVEFSD